MEPRRPKVHPNFSRKNNTEKELANNLLDGFIIEGSRGKALIEEITNQQFKKISLTSLIELTKIISDFIDRPISRNYKRKRDLIVKWFNDYEDLIIPYKDYIIPIFE